MTDTYAMATSNNDVILGVALLILALFVLLRIFGQPIDSKRSNSVRLLVLYERSFRLTYLFILVAAIFWLHNPHFSDFRNILLATFLGVGATIFWADGLKKMTEYRRVKRTFGFLKYVVAPYLESQAESVKDTLSQEAYQGELNIAKAYLFLTLVANFDSISSDFDKSWLQLVYSQDFIDAMSLESDEQFQRIADVELEVLSFTKCLTAQSVRAKYWLINGQHIPDDRQADFLADATNMRDTLIESADGLRSYSKELEKTIDDFLLSNGTTYEPSQE